MPTYPGSPTTISYRVYYINDDEVNGPDGPLLNDAVFRAHRGTLWCGDITIFRRSQHFPNVLVNMRDDDKRRCKYLVHRLLLDDTLHTLHDVV
ncbi:hypothetical protein FOMPIDRAFT_1052985 [Fomitopsis schrenkii]|uniref:Uncharacterized protein n=1 Tax=Fomitopsis schrenkii TaxID=2126942 RepID=S8F4Z4_FOMSC|nr:hypothetical protein FOMPIDRAFT_1052985 [Fomitopsis schrenkii]